MYQHIYPLYKTPWTPELSEELGYLGVKLPRPLRGRNCRFRAPQAKDEGVFIKPHGVPRQGVMLVAYERLVGDRVYVYCGKYGSELKPRRRLPRDPGRLPTGAQARFEVPWSIGRVRACGEVGGEVLCISQFELVVFEPGRMKIGRTDLFRGLLPDLPEDLESFRPACEAAVRKLHSADATKRSFYFAR